MLTSDGVGFYSYMIALVFGDTLESIDEVISPRFLLSLIFYADYRTIAQSNKN